MSALLCDGISITFGARSVLGDLHLAVASGQSCAVVGPSGAGKTTLLRVIAGLVRPDAGEVRVDGAVVWAGAASGLVGLVFQEPRLFPAMSVIENVAYGLRARGVRERTRRAAAQQLLAQVGLGDRGDERPSTLSGGEQQRVALARALCARPQVLLLDEPISAVDGPGRTELRDLLRQLRALHPVTTVVVTHDLEDATAIGDRIAIIHGGTVAQCADAATVLERPANASVAAITGNPNVLDVVVHDRVAKIGPMVVPADGPDGPATVTIRPEHVALGQPGGAPAVVIDVERRGTMHRVVVDGAFGRLEALVPAMPPGPGDQVTVATPAEHLWRFPGGDRSRV